MAYVLAGALLYGIAGLLIQTTWNLGAPVALGAEPLGFVAAVATAVGLTVAGWLMALGFPILIWTARQEARQR